MFEVTKSYTNSSQMRLLGGTPHMYISTLCLRLGSARSAAGTLGALEPWVCKRVHHNKWRVRY